MELKDILKQLAGESDGVGVVMRGGNSGDMSGEQAFVKEILSAYQRCSSKLSATMVETGMEASDITDDMRPILAMGYLTGCIHMAERMSYKALPHEMATIMENVQWLGQAKTMELYFKVLEQAVALYADHTTISDIQDRDPNGAMGIFHQRKKLEQKVAETAAPARQERKTRGPANKATLN